MSMWHVQFLFVWVWNLSMDSEHGHGLLLLRILETEHFAQT